MGLQLKFHLHFDADYHIGAGHGLGTECDSALLRDFDRRPVLRGSTIRPLLREGLRQLLGTAALNSYGRRCAASGLVGGNVEPYCLNKENLCPACRMLGSPAMAGSWRISSARPVEMTRVTTAREDPHWGGQVAYRVRVNPSERRAEPNKLFSREEGDGRLIFEFIAECGRHDANALDEAGLLVAAARMVRRLGAGRRRGRGRCSIHLVETKTSDGQEIVISGESEDLTTRWLDEFERRWLKTPKLAPTTRVETVTSAAPTLEPSGSRKRFWVILRSEEPVLIARRAEAANEFESIHQIPGAVLLGALASRVADRYDLADKNSEAYAAFAKLFRGGLVRFPTLYPCRREGEKLFPAIPTPLDLLTCSMKEGDQNDLEKKGHGFWRIKQRDKCAVCENKLTDLYGKFIVMNQSRNLMEINREIHRRVEMHNRINPITGRTASSDLFAYQAIEVGQYFVGELECDENAWMALKQMADLPAAGVAFELRLGKAIGRGHGRVYVTLIDKTDVPSLWIRLPFASRFSVGTKEVTLTLITDAILVDEWGRGYSNLGEWVRTELNLSKDAFIHQPSAIRPIDSFNAQIGLPRWRDVAVAAGSSVTFTLPEEATTTIRNKLQEWEENGIGLRRHEGYGRLVVNHPIYNPHALAGIPLGIAIPAILNPAPNEHFISREADFRKQWRDELEEVDSQKLFNPSTCPFFCGVVKLMWAEAENENGLEAVRERLNLQDTKIFLGETLQGCDKEKWWETSGGEEGLRKISKWLDELEKKINDLPDHERHRHAVIGIQIIADVIGNVACGNQKEG